MHTETSPAHTPRWQIVHLEDDELDRELVRMALKRMGAVADFIYAASAAEFAQALERSAIDVILSDFTLPGYDGLIGLALARQKRPEVPYIFVSGTIGETRAIDALKSGATDYVLKHELERLLPAVERALRERAESEGRKVAELALRQSEERYRLLFEVNPRPMWVLDAITLRFLAVNQAAIAHYGWSRDEFLALNVRELRADDGAAGGSAQRHRTKTGQIIDVEVVTHEVPFDGRPARMAIITDVTEQNRVHEELERERHLLRTLIDQFPDPIYVKDRDSRFLLANQTMAEMVGVAQPSDLIGRGDAAFFPAAEAADFRADEQRVLQGHPIRNHEEIVTTSDGGRRVLLTTKLPLRDRNGAITGMLGVGHDVTDRRAAIEAQLETEQRFAAIFQSSPVALCYGRASDGRILDVNPELCTFLGRPREALVGRTVRELQICADEGTRRFENVRVGERLRDLELKFRTPTGGERIGLLALDSLQFGPTPVFLATIVDITSRKAMELELYRAHRVESVGRLASGIAHDMNNVLAPIMMAAPLLRMPMGPGEFEKTLANIEASAKRGADLVRQLLMFGRGVDGERGPVQSGTLIRELARIASQTFPKSITIRMNVAPDVTAVRGDASQLHQVLLNLCVNARDAMPAGGVLTIAAKNMAVDAAFAATNTGASPGSYVVLSVSDTGTGIPPDIAERIFDPFFTTKEVGHGTGLGLSTVVGIVKSHGGFVRLQTEVDKGTTFHVYVPAMPAGEPRAEAAPEKQEAPRGHNELILVVDDEEGIRSILRDTLVKHGYRVLVANDGADATAAFARHLADVELVITDLEMPAMNGAGLVRVLQRMKQGIRVVVSSGIGSARRTREHTAELAALGVTTILQKPYPASRILTTIHDLLAKQ
ncbi:MAG TPA: PAS domain S-box protein [Opitutaceae bacterium]|nr:PAS domain S-box protein [Opitutaceae bacterium]